MKNNKGVKGFLKGFLYAFRGICKVISEELNMRVHLSIALNVLIFAPLLQVSRTEYALLILTIAVVLSLEMLNSAIENLCDKITREKDLLIGKIKDIAAGSVLISALFSVVIAVVILYRPIKIASLLALIINSPLYLLAVILLEVLLILFIIKPNFKNIKK